MCDDGPTTPEHARVTRLSRLLEKRRQTRLALQFLAEARTGDRCRRVAAAIRRSERSIQRLREAHRTALLLFVIALEDEPQPVAHR